MKGFLLETSLIDPELICWGSELHFNDAKNWELMNALWWQRVKWNDQDLYHHNTNNCIWYTPLKNIYIMIWICHARENILHLRISNFMPTSIFTRTNLLETSPNTVERCGSRMGTFKHMQEEIQKKISWSNFWREENGISLNLHPWELTNVC